jgi:TetR/AcrR family transcriptional regulator, transcriptional repressor for nem operon
MGRPSDARQRLVAAAIELIWNESWGAVSVDAFCERAGVKKGTFYHFFKNKNELVLAALDAHWQTRKPILDQLFSPSVPPLDRLRNYFAYVYTRQLELKAKSGRFLGCFYSAVGMGCVDNSAAVAKKVSSILGNYEKYYERALKDLSKTGLRVEDIGTKSKALFAYMEGVLTQARIQDDEALIRNLSTSALRFLGVPDEKRAA